MRLFRVTNALRRGDDKRTMSHALESVGVYVWQAKCGRSWADDGDLIKVAEEQGEPECAHCRRVVNGPIESSVRDASASVVEAAAKIQAEQQAQISRLRFAAIALEEVLGRIFAEHAVGDEGRCSSCGAVYPCVTVRLIADRSRIWRAPAEVSHVAA